MIDNIQLRGNICTCGGVWFCHDLPESDASLCPYCKVKIPRGEIYDSEDIAQQKEDGVLPEPVKNSIDKASNPNNNSFVTKMCKFCKNIVFFDEVDAPKAHFCPYCEDRIVDVELPKEVMTEEPFLGLGMDELLDQKVMVKFKSKNPFNRAKQFIYAGLDPMSGNVKLIDERDESIVWRPIENIVYIALKQPKV